MRKNTIFKLLAVLILVLIIFNRMAIAQNLAPVITRLWIDVDYYDYCDYWWYYCYEYAVIKGQISAYDPDGDPIFYTWYVNGIGVGYGDSLWYEAWREGWYEIYVKVEDIYGLSTWSGPYQVEIDFGWWCGGGCEIVANPSFGGLGLLFITFGIIIPLIKKRSL
ncbi:MAG: hypothetical protein N3C62_01035 [Synergistetes bacterium]|nr:hypothetical protein [Synergistota bacterium]MCX8127322.1 hypothetical protein [Synergistota bacterium]MDW8191791.1 hypothetical protein [Synergistota bacterium]